MYPTLSGPDTVERPSRLAYWSVGHGPDVPLTPPLMGALSNTLRPVSGSTATTRHGLFALLFESTITVKRTPSENAGDGPGILKLRSSTSCPAASVPVSSCTCQASVVVGS